MPAATCCSFCCASPKPAGLLAERAGLPAVPADLLLVLLGPVAAAGLLAERAGLPAVPAADLLLVLLGRRAGAGLLAERGGLPAVPAADLLLVLLRPEPGPACSLNAAVCPPCPPPTCCSFCCGARSRAGLLAERGGLPAVPAADLLLVLLRCPEPGRPAR